MQPSTPALPAPTTVAASVNMAGAVWIPLRVAAQRSGKTERRLAQICHGKWLGEKLARMQQPEGGKPIWYVHETADPAFARVKFPEQMAADLSSLSQGARGKVLCRLGILKEWEEQVKAGFKLGFDKVRTTRNFLLNLEAGKGTADGQAVRISLATLYNWHTAYSADGPIGLVDGRGAEKTAPGKDDPFLAEFSRLYLDQRKRSVTLCHQMVSEIAPLRGWEVRSYDQVKRYVRAIPADALYLHRHGEKVYTNIVEPYINRDTSQMRANEQWCGDHHVFDVIVNWDGELVRPWVTAWQDMRSRKIVGHHVFNGDPCQDTIFSALRHACHPGQQNCGVPEGVYIDNGKDYDCYALQGVTKKERHQKRKVTVEYDATYVKGLCAALGISVTHCEKYHGQSKPIERWFGTLEDRFGRRWDTYCGGSPDKKPDDLKLHLERGHAPTKEEFCAAFDAYVRDGYNAHPHTGDGLGGKTPDQCFAESLNVHGKRVVVQSTLDILLLKQTRMVTVGQNGVQYDGLFYGQYAAWRPQWLGKKVYLLIDSRDISRVMVWSPDGTALGWVESNEAVPHNAKDTSRLKEAKKMKARAKRVAEEFFETGPRRHESIPALMAQAEAKRRAETEAANPPPAGPSLIPVRTPLDGQIATFQRQEERRVFRKAVGAPDDQGDQGHISLLDALSGIDAPVRRQPDREAINLMDFINGGDS